MPLKDRHPATRCEPRKVLLQQRVACAGAICVDNLTIRFGSTVALDKVSVRVPARALTIVVGPGGCGKTTLLKALACEIPWGSGSVIIQQVPARLWPAKKRESRMLTRGEPGAHVPSPRRRRRTDPVRLSGGMRVRLLKRRSIWLG